MAPWSPDKESESGVHSSSPVLTLKISQIPIETLRPLLEVHWWVLEPGLLENFPGCMWGDCNCHRLCGAKLNKTDAQVTTNMSICKDFNRRMIDLLSYKVTKHVHRQGPSLEASRWP